MRVILLSIAFLFLAFSAQSQVLKSAGVWYFLDVDSMTARPAVLPNGTELAYVVGTKTVYYWNRNTSTWTAYGSTFNRDSIYFDSSIIGSGTVSDPWGVDSTLFATIAGVGDSIAAAVANYFPLQGGTLTGTGGNGFVGFPVQSSPPSTPSTGFSLYAGSTGNNISWMQPDGFFRRLVSPVTGTPRQYQFMARSYTLGDSADIANNVTSIAANYIATSNGTNLVARNLFDNNTYAGVLNSKPWQFGQWTTAGRPSGTTGYTGYNTTGNGIEWYDGTRWNYVPKADRSAFTSTYVPFVNASGQFTESANLTFNSSQFKIIGSNSTSGTYNFVLQNTTGEQVFRVDNAGSIQQAGSNLSYSGYSTGAIVHRLYSSGSTNNPLQFYVLGGNRGSAYGEFTLNNDFNSNANIGGGILFDTRDGVAPLRFFTKDNSVNPVDAMDIFDISTVGIGTNNTPINSAQLAVNSTTRGFLPPRWTAAQRAAISSPATGLLGYQTDGTEGVYVKQASAFKRLLWEGDAATTWLKTELEAGRDVDITGVASTDFRIRNTRIQFDNKFKIGSDSSFVYDPVQDTLFIMGDGVIKGITVTPFKFLGPNNTSGNFKSQISLGDWEASRGWNLGVDALETGANNMYFFNNGTGALPLALFGKTVLVGNFDLTIPSGLNPDMHVRATLSDGFVVSNSGLTTRWINTGNRLRGIKVGGITSFTKDITQDTLYNYGAIQLDALGAGTAVTFLGKTSTNEIVPVEIKRDTTIYVTDADYNFASAVTSANILKRYNRIIIYSKLSSGATSDNQIILHSASSDFLQCEIIIYSNDASADADATSIDFTTNGAVDGAGGTVSSYPMSPGQRVNIRVVDDGGYKWFFN